ncbi:MAG: biopolymer transporter ExbD [Chthoniobacteraceae bacterium]|nr:biopolymer transporter ExbD [Chthoniobacteraceae bacterium]
MHNPTKGKAARAATRNPAEEDPEFQIAPMIDILLVLLVFFMSISSTEVLQSNRAIPLAIAKDAKQPKKAPGQVIVNVSWVPINNNGSIEVDSQKFATASDLVPRLQDELLKNPLTRVLVRVDRSARWAFEREVLKAVGDAGITNVTFAVVDKAGAGSPPPQN